MQIQHSLRTWERREHIQMLSKEHKDSEALMDLAFTAAKESVPELEWNVTTVEQIAHKKTFQNSTLVGMQPVGDDGARVVFMHPLVSRTSLQTQGHNTLAQLHHFAKGFNLAVEGWKKVNERNLVTFVHGLVMFTRFKILENPSAVWDLSMREGKKKKVLGINLASPTKVFSDIDDNEKTLNLVKLQGAFRDLFDSMDQILDPNMLHLAQSRLRSKWINSKEGRKEITNDNGQDGGGTEPGDATGSAEGDDPGAEGGAGGC